MLTGADSATPQRLIKKEIRFRKNACKSRDDDTREEISGQMEKPSI